MLVQIATRLSLIVLCATLAISGLAGCAVSKTDEEINRAREVPRAEFECLREAIYFEAGGIGAGGGRAVADVILNRKADPRFPSSICGVVRQGEGNGRGCQFSYRCDSRPERFAEPRKLQLATNAARAALKRQKDTTNGALYFHSARIAPGWFATLERTASIGGNIFYRP